MPASYRDTDDPFRALGDALAFNSRDFGVQKFEAWIYGIVLGWDDEDGALGPDGDAMSEVAAQVGWDAYDVARLRRLRANFRRAEATWTTEGDE